MASPMGFQFSFSKLQWFDCWIFEIVSQYIVWDVGNVNLQCVFDTDGCILNEWWLAMKILGCNMFLYPG